MEGNFGEAVLFQVEEGVAKARGPVGTFAAWYRGYKGTANRGARGKAGGRGGGEQSTGCKMKAESNGRLGCE